MTATINASTSSGVIVTSDTSGSLALQTASTTAMTINSSQVVNLTNALPIASGGTGLTSVGTNGQVLTSNGTSLSYTTPSSGAMTLISTQTLTSQTQVAWTGLSGYDKYQLIINCYSKAGTNFVINLGYGATPTYITSSYIYRLIYNYSSTVSAYNVGGGAYFNLDYSGTGDGTNFGYENQSIIFSGTNSSTNVSAQGISYQSVVSGANTAVNTFGGVVLTSAPTTAFKISNLGGYFTGTASLYGISS